ncbi:hypothetical protein BOX15_Mlig022676g2, partial [Macrostomum lignano]
YFLIMAGSRLERFTPLFSRISGLIRSGAVAPNGAPLWYDVYARFPPAEEPRFERPVPPQAVRQILYAEDVDRQRQFADGSTSGQLHNLFLLEAPAMAVAPAAAADSSSSTNSASETRLDQRQLAHHLSIVRRLRPDLSESEQSSLAKQLCLEAEADTRDR